MANPANRLLFESEERMVPITSASGFDTFGRVAVICELPSDKDAPMKAITASGRIEELDIHDRVLLVDVENELCVATATRGGSYLVMLDSRIIILEDESWAFCDGVPCSKGREGTDSE